MDTILKSRCEVSQSKCNVQELYYINSEICMYVYKYKVTFIGGREELILQKLWLAASTFSDLLTIMYVLYNISNT